MIAMGVPVICGFPYKLLVFRNLIIYQDIFHNLQNIISDATGEAGLRTLKFETLQQLLTQSGAVRI